MGKKKTKKRNWQKELVRLNRLFKHLKVERDTKVPPDTGDRPTLKDKFRSIFSFIRTYNTSRDYQLFKETVNEDFQYLSSLPFAIYPEVKNLLLPQSVTGHALYGHSRFIDNTGKPIVFANATIEKVIEALNDEILLIPSREIAIRREELLMETFNFIKENYDKERAKLVNKEGKGLFGIKILENIEVEMASFLKGFYIGAMMDNLNFRRITNAKHLVTLTGTPFEMGGGEIYLVNADRFKATGLRPRDLSDKEISAEDINKMKEYNIIVNYEESQKLAHIIGLYIREKEGSGICDDAALIYIGKKLNTDAFWGAFIADACDTYDKHVTHYLPNGYDEYIANYIYSIWQEKYGEPVVEKDTILEIIYMSAEENSPKIGFSSSHRRLVQFENKSKYPTIVQHHRFINNLPTDNIELGFERCPSDEFYRTLKTRSSIIKLNYW